MKKVLKMLTSAISVFIVASILTTTVVFAAPNRSLSIHMPFGGTWEYNGKMDLDVTRNWSANDYRSVTCVQKIQFYTPEQVHAEALLLGANMGDSQAKSWINTAVSTAASYGIEVAKKKLISSLGAQVAGKLIPFLNVFSWGYTAVTVLDAMFQGQQLYRYSNAARKGVGLIFVQARSTGDCSEWYEWSGSPYGTYPYAKLGPNNWQFGNVTVNKDSKFTCDTHSIVTIHKGNKYTARITSETYPDIIAGTGGIVSINYVSKSGKNYYFSFTGIKTGSTGIYINNTSPATFVCKVV